ncbi:hypothetical protein QYF36_000717 [Acer negundo]|nr:hypothetical protein QYF36_000717 [Acer negundo]
MVYSAADYLELTDEYGEGNLVSKSVSFFHKNILRNWKNCILALQSCETMLPRAEKLQILSKCLNAVSMMVCTDPSLFGWPMMMYGSLQSPCGSILWNGINTGARIRSSESDWWFEDISYLSVSLFERLIKTMEAKGIRPENLVGATIMYYARKYLPESIEKLLPEKKGKSFFRFLLGLLRVALILGVDVTCKESLERRIRMQLELAILDGLLIPSYSDSDTLYNTDCVERIVNHFMSSESVIATFSPAYLDLGTSPSSEPLRKVAKLIDSYLAEVASDVNLKSGKKFSIDPCTHASQNERLPLRVVLQVLLFEQMQLRTALAGCLHVLDTESAPADMENMRSRVGELEEEYGKIKQEMKRVTKSHSSLSSPRLVAKKIGCRLLPRSSDAQADTVDSTGPSPRASVEQPRSSRHSRHRKSFSVF